MRRRDVLSAFTGLALTPLASSCASEEASTSRGTSARPPAAGRTLVVKHQPLGESDALPRLFDRFEAEHPGVAIRAEALPNASDVAHQFFLTALEGGARDFDVFIVDVVWVAEFARAGWLLDLSPWIPPDALRRDFLAPVAEAIIVDERTFAVPWYVDTGILYYRTDLVDRPPRTYAELRTMAEAVTREHSEISGYVWQGRQYEGLVCNVYEAIWGHGGETMQHGRLLLQTDAARDALSYLQSLLRDGLSPPQVASSTEEETRRAFQRGGALFMRNWPYAFSEAEREGSKLRGKVGLAPLPTSSGEPGHGALGGYQLAVNAAIDANKRDLAVELVRHLTSRESSIALAAAYGRSPARRDAYADPALEKTAPLIASLYPAFERAKPRPTTPYYMMLSDVLQGEFSAAITGVRSPRDALDRAQFLVDRWTEAR
jgi:multiple sugar transport system substrate-binding protein